MSTCSITIQTRGPEHPEADSDQQYSEETRVTVSTWGGSSFEFGDKTPADLSDLQQTLQFVYIAGVMDSGGDVDAALERFRAMLVDQRPPAPRFTADEVTTALEAAGSIHGAAERLKASRDELKALIIHHRIEWPRAPVLPTPDDILRRPGAAAAQDAPPLAKASVMEKDVDFATVSPLAKICL